MGPTLAYRPVPFITVAAAGPITASMHWDTNATSTCRSSLGTLVAAGGGAKPETISFNATAPGTYTFRFIGSGGSPNQYLPAGRQARQPTR